MTEGNFNIETNVIYTGTAGSVNTMAPKNGCATVTGVVVSLGSNNLN